MTHPYFAGSRHPRILAHRGLATNDDAETAVWENSAAAFATAHAAGVEYIETDCRLTADGELVLFHDETLLRLFGDPRPVSDLRAAELADLMAPHGGLLTVREALDAFPEVRFNIDAKTDVAAAPLGAAVAEDAHRVLIASFSDERRRRVVAAALRAGAELRPAASGGTRSIAALRLASIVRALPRRRLHDIDAVQVPERHRGLRVLTPALIDAAHRVGIEVHVWTVNEPSDMSRLVAAGVDGIVTDRADVAVRTLRGKPRSA